MTTFGRTMLGPAYRCGACGYSLLGLPDRGAETVCPECGTQAPPKSKSSKWSGPSACALLLCAVASMAGLFIAAISLLTVVEAARWSSGLDALVASGMAVSVPAPAAFAGVVVWASPTGRWPAARYAAAAALAMMGMGSFLAAAMGDGWGGGLLPVFSAGCIIALLQWELAPLVGLDAGKP